jgi:steroid 5-alpha reductase family enzyme
VAVGAVLWILVASVGAAVFWWLVSLGTKDTAVIDRWWGVGIALLCVLAWQLADTTGPRLYVLFLVAAWGVRLSAHLYGRKQGRPEDQRYAAMRARHGASWWWRSLVFVFVLQGLLMFVVGAAAFAPLLVPAGPAFGWLDGVAVALATAGLVIEGVADGQLQLWRRAGSPGGVFASGLWQYSRHPNYFGELLFWWGVWLAALAHGFWWAVVSPLVVTVLIVRVSGIPLVERGLARRSEYAAYRRRTSAIVPWPPRRP